MNNTSHTIMQGLVYPAFLGTFIVNLVSVLLNQSIGISGFFKSVFLLVLFGYLFLETSSCPKEHYRKSALCLDVLEIVAMTINFAFVGLFQIGQLDRHKELLATPLFAWTGFFLINFFLIYLAERYRTAFLHAMIYPSDKLKWLRYVCAIAFLATLPIYVDWGRVIDWGRHVLRMGLHKSISFLDAILPFVPVKIASIHQQVPGAFEPRGPALRMPAPGLALELFLLFLLFVVALFLVYAFGHGTKDKSAGAGS